MNLKKKILAATTAAAVSVPLILGTPPAEAVNIGKIGSIANVILEGEQLKAKTRAVVKQLNETKPGQEAVYQNITKDAGVDNNPIYTERLDRIMANLTKGVAAVDPTINDLPYKYFVANDDSLNAFCTMGHVMAVNRGTFNILATDDEIAAVVGHEMGHGQKNHSAKSYDKVIDQQVASGVLNAALGGDALTSTLTEIALKHRGAHKDKKFETEADLLSIDYLVNTPYNIGATAAVMQKFVELENGAKKSQLQVLFNPSDHPGSDKRRDACAKKVSEFGGNHATAKDGVVSVNKKVFVKPVAAGNLSAAGRSYFVLGNLARAYHDGQNKQPATVQNGTVMLGNQPIITPVEGDEDAQTLADRLNAIK